MGSQRHYEPTITPTMVRVAKEFDRWRHENWRERTFTKVAEMTKTIGAKLYPRTMQSEKPKYINATRLCRLAAWAAPEDQTRDCAVMPQRHELPILAEVMGTTFEALTQLPSPSVIIKPDTSADIELQMTFRTLLSKHLANSSELLGWAEFVPCSLETPAFMRQHHRSIFTPLYDGDREGLQKVLKEYNELGDRRRAELQGAGSTRTWKFTNLLFESDFLQVVQSPRTAWRYRYCTKPMRREYLDHLAAFVSDPTWKVTLAVVPDAKAASLKARLQDYDSMVMVIGQNGEGTFGWKRNHRGELWFTERPKEIMKDQQLLEQIRRQSKLYTATDLHHMTRRLTRWR